MILLRSFLLCQLYSWVIVKWGYQILVVKDWKMHWMRRLNVPIIKGLLWLQGGIEVFYYSFERDGLMMDIYLLFFCDSLFIHVKIYWIEKVNLFFKLINTTTLRKKIKNWFKSFLLKKNTFYLTLLSNINVTSAIYLDDRKSDR